MKKIQYCCALYLALVSITALSQTKPLNLYDSARVYYEKRDFKKAYQFYDDYYSDPKHGQSNYDTFYAAVAACQAGRYEKIAYYLRRSAEIGYDLSSYHTFADDPLAACLHSRPEWQNFIVPFKVKADSAMKSLKSITDVLNDTTIRVNQSLLTNNHYWQHLAEKSSPAKLLQRIKNFSQYPAPKRTGFWTLYHIRVNDTLNVPFLVYIPKAYNIKTASSLYVFMHGGVGGPKNFSNPAYEPNSQAQLFKKAFTQNAFVIFPFGKKSFNWLYHQLAFETVLNEIKLVKSLYHIDDNRVYIGGHSDGGRGAVWFAMNKPTPFAAFYGICYFPSLYTGNTILRNLHNQTPFYGISATDDQLFPLGMVNGVLKYDKQAGGNWHTTAVKGTHGLPYASPDSIYFLFDSLAAVKRNPAPKTLVWETDNIINGQYYWVSIDKLDTTAAPANWHTPLNPTLTNKEGKTGKVNFSKHKSGALQASVTGNVITVNTSCIQTFTIHFTPGLVDFTKPVTIIVNGQKQFAGNIALNKDEMISSFMDSKDRDMVTLALYTYRFPDK